MDNLNKNNILDLTFSINQKTIRKTYIYLFGKLKELGKEEFLLFVSNFFNISRREIEKKLIIISIISIFEKKNIILLEKIKKIHLTEGDYNYIKINLSNYKIFGVFLNLLNSSIIESSSKRKIEKILNQSFNGKLDEIIFQKQNQIFIEGFIVKKIKNIKKDFKKLQKFENLNFGFQKLTILKKTYLTVCMSHKDNISLMKNVAIPSLLNQTYKNLLNCLWNANEIPGIEKFLFVNREQNPKIC